MRKLLTDKILLFSNEMKNINKIKNPNMIMLRIKEKKCKHIGPDHKTFYNS